MSLAMTRAERETFLADTHGPQVGEVYLRATAAEHAGAVLVTVKPERWLTVDYGKWGG